MTIPEPLSGTLRYVGDGVTKQFPYGFKIFSSEDIAATVSVNGVSVLAPYSVYGVGDDGGGYIEFSTAPSNGALIVVSRNTPLDQVVSYTEYDPFSAATHEYALDRMETQIQTVAERLRFSPRFAFETGLTDKALPTPSPSHLLGWNATGDGFANYSGIPANAATTGIVTLSSFDSFADMLSSVGSTPATVIIDVGATVSVDSAAPETLHFWFLRSGGLSISAGVTLTINGDVTAGAFQIFGGDGTVVFGDRAKDNVNAAWFASDLWDSLKKAVACVCAGKGGTITLPVAVYDADTPIVIQSEYRVNLKSDMGSMQFSTGGVLASAGYIRPRAGLLGTDSIIEYKAPTGLSRYRNGSGTVEGLAFLDDSNLADADIEARRTVPVRAALKLTDFDFGVVRDCRFMYIKGSAIATDRAVQTSIVDPKIMHCGDTGKPAIDLGGDSGTITQSFNIIGPRVEHCFNAPYIKASAYAQDVKILGGQFEALSGTNTADKSCQTFILGQGQRLFIHGCGFNKNAALKVSVEATAYDAQMSGCSFAGENVLGAFSWAAPYGGISNVTCRGALSNLDVQATVSGYKVPVSNLSLIYGGQLLISGPDVTVTNLEAYYTFWLATGTPTVDEVVRVTGRRCKLVGGSIVGCGDSDTPISGLAGVSLEQVFGKVFGTSFRKLDRGVVFNVGSQLVDGCDMDAVTTPFVNHDSYASVNIRNCLGFKTEASGSASMGASATEVTVTHGLAVTPSDVQVSFASNPGSATKVWAHTITSTDFKIAVDSAPGGTGVSIKWRAARTVN